MGKKKNTTTRPVSFPDLTDDFLLNRSRSIGIGLMVLAALTALFVYQFGLTAAADDASYIIRGKEFFSLGAWPGEQGPLYCVLLGVVILIAGMNLTLLKLLSLVGIIGFVYYFWKFFVHHVSPGVLLTTLVILLLSPIIMPYASINYSETVFMLISIGCVIWFFKFFDLLGQSDFKIKIHSKTLLILISLIVALYLTRTVGIFIIGSLSLFLIFHKKYQAAVALILGSIAGICAIMVIRYVFWDIAPFSNGQASMFLAKNAYDASKGNESLMGFVTRFHQNSIQYLSRHFFRMLGFLPFDNETKNVYGYGMIYILSATLLIYIFKRNKYLFFSGLYGLSMCVITFVILHVFWNQDRLIIPFFPFVLLFLFGSLLQLFKDKWPALRPVVYVLMLLLPLISLNRYTRSVNIKSIQEGLLGNRLYNYTTEWKNYIEAIQYIGKSEPKTTFAATRKAELAQIYSGGRNFYGINQAAEANNVDEFLKKLKDAGVNTFILDQCLGTFSGIYNTVEARYPGTFKSYKQFGGKDRPTHLCKINYPPSIK